MVDNTHSQLVTCGTVFQGSCQSRSLSNISLFVTNVIAGTRAPYGFVASTDPTHPAVAFVAPGPSNSVRLYVGTDDAPSSSSHYRNIRREYTCGVTSRYLSGDNTFDIPPPTDRGRGTFALLSEEAATSPDFILNYVAGFSVEGFSYFLTTQPAVYPANNSTSRVSKMSQVCQEDDLFDSYVEMRISCRSDAKDYNLVQAATLLQPGSRLASTLGLSTTEHLLVAAFYGERDSALCIYRLSDIRKRFTDNIQACYNDSSLIVGRQYSWLFFYRDITRYCTPDPQVRKTDIFIIIIITHLFTSVHKKPPVQSKETNITLAVTLNCMLQNAYSRSPFSWPVKMSDSPGLSVCGGYDLCCRSCPKL